MAYDNTYKGMWKMTPIDLGGGGGGLTGLLTILGAQAGAALNASLDPPVFTNDGLFSFTYMYTYNTTTSRNPTPQVWAITRLW